MKTTEDPAPTYRSEGQLLLMAFETFQIDPSPLIIGMISLVNDRKRLGKSDQEILSELSKYVAGPQK